MCDLYPPSAGEVVVEMELLLQLQSLEPRVGLAAPPSWTPAGACRGVGGEGVRRSQGTQAKSLPRRPASQEHGWLRGARRGLGMEQHMSNVLRGERSRR